MTKNQLYKWRVRLSLSQQAAADALGISLRMYQHYEAGGYKIPTSIELACEALENRHKHTSQ